METDLSGIESDLKEIKEDLIKKFDENICGDESKKSIGNVIGDLFYKSMKSFFDTGFKLAEKLNDEYLSKE
jgi:hypothetical protein